MIARANWNGVILKPKCGTCNVITIRSVPKRHIKIPHLLQGNENGHSAFLKNVNFGSARRAGWVVYDQPLKAPRRLRVRKAEFSAAWHELETALEAALTACLDECHYPGSTSHRACTARV